MTPPSRALSLKEFGLPFLTFRSKFPCLPRARRHNVDADQLTLPYPEQRCRDLLTSFPPNRMAKNIQVIQEMVAAYKEAIEDCEFPENSLPFDDLVFCDTKAKGLLGAGLVKKSMPALSLQECLELSVKLLQHVRSNIEDEGFEEYPETLMSFDELVSEIASIELK